MPTYIIGGPGGTETEASYSSRDLATRILPQGYYIKRELPPSLDLPQAVQEAEDPVINTPGGIVHQRIQSPDEMSDK